MSGNNAQLVFEMPVREALGSEDYLVGTSNAAAVELVDRWPQWPISATVITGPEGCGKSHLANVWRHKSGASLTCATVLTNQNVVSVKPGSALVVEDIDRGIGDETALFHILNLVREAGISVLLTSRQRTGDLPIALPDLRSRLRALPFAEIEPPDDALLSGILVKLFADRQLTVEPQVISYLLSRMERSMRAARQLVANIDRLALTMQRRVTKQLVYAALSDTEQQAPEP